MKLGFNILVISNFYLNADFWRCLSGIAWAFFSRFAGQSFKREEGYKNCCQEGIPHTPVL